MSLQNASILDGATISVSGGTAVTFTSDGQSVANGAHIINASQSDLRLREHMTLKSRLPKYNNTTGKYGKLIRSAVLTTPLIDSDGANYFPVVRIEVESRPDMTAAQELKLRVLSAQILTDTDFASFWTTGNVA